MRFEFLAFVYYFVHISYAVKNKNNQGNPDLSHLRDGSSSEEGLDLSLGVGSSAQSSHHNAQQDVHTSHTLIRQNQVGSERAFDMRTKEFKQLQKQYPNVDFRTEKQKADQGYQKTYRTESRSKLDKTELQKVNAKIQKSRRDSYQRRLQNRGYGYGLQGEINKLRKKEREEGKLSPQETQQLKQLRKDNSERVTEARRRRRGELQKTQPAKKKGKE